MRTVADVLVIIGLCLAIYFVIYSLGFAAATLRLLWYILTYPLRRLFGSLFSSGTAYERRKYKRAVCKDMRQAAHEEGYSLPKEPPKEKPGRRPKAVKEMQAQIDSDAVEQAIGGSRYPVVSKKSIVVPWFWKLVAFVLLIILLGVFLEALVILSQEGAESRVLVHVFEYLESLK